jgi:uncharacterized protein YgbK (DUF1537 family)
VGPELEGFFAAWPTAGKTFFVPAFPALGRTLRRGRLRVNGRPLHKTAFGRDPLHPASTDLVESFAGGSARRLRIPDVADEADLRRAAAEAVGSGGRAAVGSAGFADALARLFKSGTRRAGAAARPGRRAVLVVSGSAHPVSRAQVDRLRRVRPDVPLGEAGRFPGNPGRTLEDVVRRAAAAARKNGARRFAVTGGQTAAALAAALRVRRWRVLSEVERGVPLLSSVGPGARTWWVVKPGGFGKENAWKRAIQCLART